MKKYKWDKKKFVNNIAELIIGTAYMTIPIFACLLYGLSCKILGL